MDGMIGMERTIIQSLPRLNLVSLQNSHSLSLVAFDYQGIIIILRQISDRYGRKNLLFWMVLALPIRLF
jgi:hypothetical protein